MLSRSICWVSKSNYNISVIFHLLDDLLTIDRPTECDERTMALLSLIFNKLNIALSAKKTVDPTCVLEYLGIILDTVNMQTRLTEENGVLITGFIQTILYKRSCTRKELEQLLGYLNFASRVKLPGRAFVTYLYRLMSSAKEAYHYVHLNKECNADLQMWLELLTHWNGINLFYENELTNASNISLHTDASSTIGFGGFFQNEWFYDSWPEELPKMSDYCVSMAVLELYSIVVVAVLWGKPLSGENILFYCDNIATVQIIKNGRSKDPFIMKLMRRLTMCAVTAMLNNFAIFSEHVPGSSNCIADALSRFQIQRFRELAPGATITPTSCPPLSKTLWTAH